ncbi:MAG TPA: carotenoid oxygenase family protein [Kofleriaceae bacterium]|nr:carotenoid oxygenase family protein [Kofleriaceae bacterium]
MRATVVKTWPSRLPADDDHPYRTGAWRPNLVEYDADELDVVEGAIPDELRGTCYRNTENPLLPSLGRYHPFDGDGMLHAIRFAGGRASYRNRMVRTAGLAAELEAGAPQWAGIIEAPSASLRDGWGARTRMKDASSTDVVVHRGLALTTFYQCGDVYRLDGETLDPRGTAPWADAAAPWGVSAHPKLDERTGELLFFSYAKEAPYLKVGVVGADGALRRLVDVPLPGPRLPHDLAFTERFAIVNDLPLFWDPALLAKGVHRPRFARELPSRFGLVDRHADAPVRWFEAEPTYVLHWINAFERGGEVVLDGYRQADPLPRPDPADGPWGPLKKMVDVHAMGARPWRWRFDLATGRTREEPLGDGVSEFPSVNGRRGGRAYRHAWSMTARPGWFLFDGLVRLDVDGGAEQRFRCDDGVYLSEAPMAPRPRAAADEDDDGARDDDGWLVTFTADVPGDRSECWIFDAARIGDGPIARVALPERICHGTHACWAPA